MLPISDASVDRGRRPVVKITLIAISTLVFICGLSLNDFETFRFTYRFGVIPAELSSGEALKVIPVTANLGVDVASPIIAWGTVFTSMFMHGGWMHFLGNMLYLWVFGDNIEARLGHVKYLLFYLGAGVAAAWAQVATDLDSRVPPHRCQWGHLWRSGSLPAHLPIQPDYHLGLLFLYHRHPRTCAISPRVLVYIAALSVGSAPWGRRHRGRGWPYMAHVGGLVAGVLFMAGYKLLSGEPIWPRRPLRPLGY